MSEATNTGREGPWSFEVCQDCNEPNLVGFGVADEIWEQVMGKRNAPGVFCIRCFDKRATEKGVAWDMQPMNFYPVSTVSNAKWGRQQQFTMPEQIAALEAEVAALREQVIELLVCVGWSEQPTLPVDMAEVHAWVQQGNAEDQEIFETWQQAEQRALAAEAELEALRTEVGQWHERWLIETRALREQVKALSYVGNQRARETREERSRLLIERDNLRGERGIDARDLEAARPNALEREQAKARALEGGRALFSRMEAAEAELETLRAKAALLGTAHDLLEYVAERDAGETLGSIKVYVGTWKGYLQEATREWMRRYDALTATEASPAVGEET